MTTQVQNGTFNPGSGDRMQVRGGLKMDGGAWLTNSANRSHSNTISGTFTFTDCRGNRCSTSSCYSDGDDPIAGPNAESLDLPSGKSLIHTTGAHRRCLWSIMPVALRRSVAASHPITFQVNMSVQTTRGHFLPQRGDLVQLWGNNQPMDRGAVEHADQQPYDTNLYNRDVLR